MPKATVDENDLSVPRQADVGISGKIRSMDSKAIAHSVKQRPNDQLRFGVFASNLGHYPASFILVEDIYLRPRIHLREEHELHQRSGRQAKAGQHCLFAGQFQSSSL